MSAARALARLGFLRAGLLWEPERASIEGVWVYEKVNNLSHTHNTHTHTRTRLTALFPGLPG